MINTLRRTESGIYFIHNYTPTKKMRYASEYDCSITKQIWQYKDGDDVAIAKFTEDLMWAISHATSGIRTSNLALVAVPPSKVDKYSAVAESIEIIKNWYDQGKTQEYNCFKTIMDFSTLLTRVDNVSTSHEGRRATYEEHLNSISCRRSRLSRYWSTFVLIDDVTTTGTSLYVCRDILLENGANEKYIVRIALAQTI